VIKFESRDTALAWYNCAEYQTLLPLRLAATEGFGVLVDGYAAPRASVVLAKAVPPADP
jgi:hypothetical protein